MLRKNLMMREFKTKFLFENMKITRSIKRYISHQAYGGHQYENTELLVIYETDSNPQNIESVSKDLYKSAKADIDKAVIEVKKSIPKEKSSDKDLVSPF